MMKRVPDEKWEESFDSALIMAWLGGKIFWTPGHLILDSLTLWFFFTWTIK
jgi:hypothetical protein